MDDMTFIAPRIFALQTTAWEFLPKSQGFDKCMWELGASHIFETNFQKCVTRAHLTLGSVEKSCF